MMRKLLQYFSNIVICTFSDACSSRSTPKPRPPSPTLRPNITIQTYTCPPEYDTRYCLNGATCFTVKIGESILYNCECSEGYMGQRCEFKDLDGTYLPSKNRAMLEQAGITSSVAIIVIMIICICCYLYVHRRSKKESASRRIGGHDEVDSTSRPPRPFSGQYSSKLHHHSVAVPASHRTYPCPDAFPSARYQSPPMQRILQQTSFANVPAASPTSDNCPPVNNFQSYHLQLSSTSPPSSSPYCTSISVEPPHLVVSEVIPEAEGRTSSPMGHQSPAPPRTSSPNPCSDPPRLVVTSTYSTPSSDKPRLCV